MKVLVFGAGGIGGYFGGRLARAGEEVVFLARGAHLAALRDRGLRVQSASGDFALPVRVTDDPAALGGPVDLVLIAVKSYDTPHAVAAIAPVVGADTAILTFQNGVTNHTAFAAAYGPERVLAGTARVEAAIGEPGLIVQPSPFARLAIGAIDPAGAAVAHAVVATFASAGLDVRYVDDVLRELWEKFIFLAPLAGVTTLTQLPVGEVRARPHARELLHGAIAETADVGRALGAALAPGAGAETAAFVDTLPPPMKTSLQRDAERGGRLEVEALQGDIVRFGRETGVPTPLNLALYVYLATLDGRRGDS